MKRISILFSALLASLLITVSACHKSKTISPPDIGYNYFPLKVGSWIEYDVDSTYYVNSVPQNLKYRIRETVESLFLDNANRPEFRIERMYKPFIDTIPYDQLEWEIANVWVANSTSSTAERVEEDQRYLKLVFPVVSGKKWNGNAFNSMQEWDYVYDVVDAPLTKVFSFDSTTTVNQTGLNDPLINTQTGKEIYAKHVGMIYKYYKSVKMLPDTSGSEYTMTISDYSH